MHFPNSVKSSERVRRGCSKKLLIKGLNTLKPPDFREFLTNGENKSQLFNLMKRVWSSNDVAGRIRNKVRIIIHEGIAFEISSPDGKSVLLEE